MRSHRILSALFATLEANGLLVEPRDELNSFCVHYGDVKINCNLREKRKRVREGMRGTGATRFALKPSGKLVFAIEHYFNKDFPFPVQWCETSTLDLDAMIPGIVSALMGAGQSLQQVQNAELEAAEEEGRQRRDANRWKAFTELAEHLETVCRIGRFVEALERGAVDGSKVIGDRPISEWFEWAKFKLEKSNPLSVGAEQIFDEIAKTTEVEWENPELGSATEAALKAAITASWQREEVSPGPPQGDATVYTAKERIPSLRRRDIEFVQSRSDFLVGNF